MSKRPQVKTMSFYEYSECRDYLEKKYNYRERDYAGKYKKDEKGKLIIDPDMPYQDFWHWVTDKFEVQNGGFITFYKEFLDDDYSFKEQWQKDIFQRYIDEFANEKGKLILHLYW